MMPASNQGSGMNTGFPDTCNTPSPSGVLPITYPNLGNDALGLPFSPSVFVSMLPGHSQTAKPTITNGDSAGVSHSMFMQSGGCTMGNPIVHVSGMPAEHMCTTAQGNTYNCSVDAKLVPSVTNVLITACLAPSWLADLAGAPDTGLGGALDARGRLLQVRRGGLAERAGLRRGDLVDAARLERAREGFVAAPTVSLELAGEDATLSVRRMSWDVPRRVRDALESAARAGARRLTLDLRGNPGGDARVAALLAADLLPAGLRRARVATFASPHGAFALGARAGAFAGRFSVRVRVDANTASAAEILAACLARLGAPLVGGPTLGKRHGVRLAL